MSFWVVTAVVVGVLVVVAALRVVLRGKDDRAARRELRQLRWKERDANTHGAAELRRNMYMVPLPGKGTTPGGP
jgi:signal transduction histidine kinase